LQVFLEAPVVVRFRLLVRGTAALPISLQVQ
jgi:hypothetical protein